VKDVLNKGNPGKKIINHREGYGGVIWPEVFHWPGTLKKWGVSNIENVNWAGDVERAECLSLFYMQDMGAASEKASVGQVTRTG